VKSELQPVKCEKLMVKREKKKRISRFRGLDGLAKIDDLRIGWLDGLAKKGEK